MKQSFENTFRLPYLFSLEGEDDDVDGLIQTLESSSFEVSTRDPLGHRSIRVVSAPWWYLADPELRDGYSRSVARIIESFASAWEVSFSVIRS